ncbi:beta-carbonic anhydrase, carboxysomal [Crocosphaera subtropica ATCC 51142]|uniref:Carbonic anhydrase n=1 Tax=Crocosphaera subtropica (strain ATCC 51142 / BH68) TaxID=43989 RepID=B1WPN7_CROS5|nr:carbonic anhydrase [Crocosphaera subtropica]ACB51607.1 beta-carbonic anhydrase, carboxysomal [Crocosphaera subtropica ATCC 51142]
MKKLIEGLQKFQTGYFSSHRELFEELSHGQHPRILFITCSDSRVDPNLITQAEVGEIFVIRNAGNIIPPFGAANGGEGAAIEYAISALDIEQVIVCGHSHCGAMKGLLKLNSLQEKMPLVYDWLKHAEATRRLVNDNYKNLEGEELLEVTVAENVLTQLENLQTYPVIRSRLHQRNLTLHGWIYRIESGEVLEYDRASHDFIAPQSSIGNTEPEYLFHPTCHIPVTASLKVPTVNKPKASSNGKNGNNGSALPGYEQFSPEQAQRIYRGSH